MAGRARKMCGASRCTKTVPSGIRYCDEHRREHDWHGASGRPRSRNIPDAVKLTVLRRDGFLCRLGYDCCEGFGTTVDHITPVTEGGSDLPANLQTACVSCHQRKSSREGLRAQGANVAGEPRSVGAPGTPKPQSSPQPPEQWTPRTIHLKG
jgi:5-methylcytosine-specific restriction enzyme A